MLNSPNLGPGIMNREREQQAVNRGLAAQFCPGAIVTNCTYFSGFSLFNYFLHKVPVLKHALVCQSAAYSINLLIAKVMSKANMLNMLAPASPIWGLAAFPPLYHFKLNILVFLLSHCATMYAWSTYEGGRLHDMKKAWNWNDIQTNWSLIRPTLY